MKHKASIATAALLLLAGPIGAQTQVPNTFQAGQPARAAEVNDNFTAVEASVDDNAADIANNAVTIQSNTTSIAALTAGSGILAYSQGVPIGRVLSPGDGSQTHIWLLSDAGFAFSVEASPNANSYLGGAKTIYYSGVNCTGQSFIDQNSDWQNIVGRVFKTDGANPPFTFYTLRGGSPVTQNQVVASFTANDLCTNRIETKPGVFEVFPNDEAVTGVPNAAPTGPLMLGMP